MPIISAATRVRLQAWVEAGGTLVLGPLSGFRSEQFTAFTDSAFGGLEDLIGADSALRFTVQWVEDQVELRSDGLAGLNGARLKSWCEAFTPRADCQALAHYQGGYGDGLASIVDHRLGAGRVVTVGGLLEPEPWGELIATLCHDAGVTTLPHCDDVVVVPRLDANGALAGYACANLSGETRSVPVGTGHELITDNAVTKTLTLAPWGVGIMRLSS
ncbi:MAG: beta-galactosidase trimerization domain-containing protein [Planctomycetota bacterium]|jgi:beta-galactosidase GanA|nr:beta-galactosidase trimerization domain-containing protein [Planctomycetota bacterium]